MNFIAQVALCLVVATAEAQTVPTARAAEPPAKAVAGAEATRQLTVANTPWTGDFDKMLQRRMIRVYAPYSRSLYYVDKGRERGIAAELIRDFERWVNQSTRSSSASVHLRSTSSPPRATRWLPISMAVLPTSRSATCRPPRSI
jgi:hypothetical protein